MNNRGNPYFFCQGIPRYSKEKSRVLRIRPLFELVVGFEDFIDRAFAGAKKSGFWAGQRIVSGALSTGGVSGSHLAAFMMRYCDSVTLLLSLSSTKQDLFNSEYPAVIALNKDLVPIDGRDIFHHFSANIGSPFYRPEIRIQTRNKHIRRRTKDQFVGGFNWGG